VKFQRVLIAFVFIPFLSHAIELDDADTQSSQTSYLSPTRLKQTPHDIPASVSRITQETIEKLQINKVPDLFRYIAGMITIQRSGFEYFINYHGANVVGPSHVQLLIDGAAISLPAYPIEAWSTLPIGVSDIDYIEITRSPSAATYGINSKFSIVFSECFKRRKQLRSTGFIVFRKHVRTAFLSTFGIGDRR
jgi:outer membrane cobalamin receptor